MRTIGILLLNSYPIAKCSPPKTGRKRAAFDWRIVLLMKIAVGNEISYIRGILRFPIKFHRRHHAMVAFLDVVSSVAIPNANDAASYFMIWKLSSPHFDFDLIDETRILKADLCSTNGGQITSHGAIIVFSP